MLTEFYKSRSKWLQEEVDHQVLSIFRIGYGLFMTYVMINYFRIGLVKNMFVLPAVNFAYDFLKWMKPLPEAWMNGLLLVLLICAIGITLGVFFKWSCRIFALGYAYLFLLDKSIYNNHIYLFILLALLLSFTDADRGLSLNKRSSGKSFRIPRWHVFILQVQVIIVYFYGGIAKLTYDWMVRCQPVRLLLDNLSPDHFLAPLLKNEVGVYVLNYGGLLLDLLAPLLLWSKPIRRWAIYLFIIFHLTNSRIFSDIGVFPYLMLFALMLFYEWRELPLVGRLLNNRIVGKGTSERLGLEEQSSPGHLAYKYLLMAYFAFQLLFPFRGFFLPNDHDWTTIGNRFSWRMKVDSRQLEEMKFSIFDEASNQTYPVEIQTMVNDVQIRNLYMDPRSVADFARYIKTEAMKYGVGDPQIKAVIRTKYNGRPAQLFVDPDTDLASVTYSPFKKLTWVKPVDKKASPD